MENRYRYEYVKMNIRQCQYPGCTTWYKGKGFSKYCEKHRAREYRKVIDKLNRKPVVLENPNQLYKHDLTESKILEFQCAACFANFEIKVYPGIYTYPKYCPEHRNEYKRHLYIDNKPVPFAAPVEEIIYEDYVEPEMEYEEDRELVNGVVI